MRFLNPKTDLAFKKIFGSDSSRDIVISFLNAMLALTGEDAIADVTILDPYQAPKIQGMKDTFLDVRVKDCRGRSYVVEMQVLNVPGFEKRVLYNACKAYVGQLAKGDGYHLLSDVVAVTITDFIMFPELERVISQFRLRADENELIRYRDLELAFAELPKFTKDEDDLETTLERWLFFLKTAGDLTAVPRALAAEPAILKALDIANRAAWTDEELDAQEKREIWIGDQLRIQEDAKKAHDELQKALREKDEAAREAEQMAWMAMQEGVTQGKAEIVLRQLRRKHGALSPKIEAQVRAASSDQLDEWMDRLMDGNDLADVFDEPTTH
ncbi:MAG: Rpn family recombination-promoting nuclease/putative transposase [Alphaproteobacteria bacterium]|nr:Rpn family recombination-promoting nuclease/putative transposase [Alphaproteobacteria bacterium]